MLRRRRRERTPSQPARASPLRACAARPWSAPHARVLHVQHSVTARGGAGVQPARRGAALNAQDARNRRRQRTAVRPRRLGRQPCLRCVGGAPGGRRPRCAAPHVPDGQSFLSAGRARLFGRRSRLAAAQMRLAKPGCQLARFAGAARAPQAPHAGSSPARVPALFFFRLWPRRTDAPPPPAPNSAHFPVAGWRRRAAGGGASAALLLCAAAAAALTAPPEPALFGLAGARGAPLPPTRLHPH